MPDKEDNPGAEGHRPDPPSDQPKFLPTGTFLHTSCPACSRDLLEDDWVHFNIVGPSGEQGEFHFSPRFNVFDKRSTVPLAEGDEIKDLQCPGCRNSMIDPAATCGLCGSRVVKVHINAMRLNFNLYFCVRIGCHWHGMPDEDREQVLLDQPPGVD